MGAVNVTSSSGGQPGPEGRARSLTQLEAQASLGWICREILTSGATLCGVKLDTSRELSPLAERAPWSPEPRQSAPRSPDGWFSLSKRMFSQTRPLVPCQSGGAELGPWGAKVAGIPGSPGARGPGPSYLWPWLWHLSYFSFLLPEIRDLKACPATSCNHSGRRCLRQPLGDHRAQTPGWGALGRLMETILLRAFCHQVVEQTFT